MSKKYGLISEYALVRKDMSRTVIGYGLVPEEDGEHATWYEVVIYKKKTANPTLSQVKDAVEADINAQTDQRILNGFRWEDDNGDTINVWLSDENQRNFSEAQRRAAARGAEEYTPKKFKIGEVDGAAKYRTFTTLDELNAFYDAVFDYIEACIGYGWLRKDSIDWQPYEEALEHPVDDTVPEPEPEPEDETPDEEQDEETDEQSDETPDESEGQEEQATEETQEEVTEETPAEETEQTSEEQNSEEV